MSIIAETPVASTVSPEVLKWVEEITAIRSRVLGDRITSLEDPRAQQIINSEHYSMDDDGEALARYFTDDDPVLEQIILMYFTELPACPIPKPAWADTQNVLLGEWPEISLDRSRTVEAGPFTVQVDDMVTVFAEPTIYPDEKVYCAGDVAEDGPVPRLAIGRGGYLKDFLIDDICELDILGELLLDLSRAIHIEKVSA